MVAHEETDLIEIAEVDWSVPEESNPQRLSDGSDAEKATLFWTICHRWIITSKELRLVCADGRPGPFLFEKALAS